MNFFLQSDKVIEILTAYYREYPGYRVVALGLNTTGPVSQTASVVNKRSFVFDVCMFK